MMLTTDDQKLEKSIEQMIARWVIAEKLTFVFWTQDKPQKVCARLIELKVAENFQAELIRHQTALPDTIDFEILTEKEMPDIEAVSALM